MNYDTALQTAISIAHEAGDIVRNAFPRAALAHIDLKGAVNPVTETDTAAEELIIARLTPTGHQQLSRTKLIEPTGAERGRKIVWSHPAFANRHIYARNDKEIVCASLAATKRADATSP